MPESEWVKQDDGSYLTVRKDVAWRLGIIDDGVLPAGWRLWRDDGKTRHPYPVAAKGRSIPFVLEQASMHPSLPRRRS